MAWSELPDDLLELVLERLPLCDYLCSAAVCRQWRAAQTAHRARSAPSPPPSTIRLPWLAILTPGIEAPRVCSPFEGRLYRLRFPRHNWSGSPLNGWTTVVPQERAPYLFNPLTGAEIGLPELPQRFPIERAFLSARPTDAAGCVVMVFDTMGHVFLSRVGSRPSGWTLVPLPVPVAACSGFVAVDGKFYGAIGHPFNLIVINPIPEKPEVDILVNMEVLEHTTIAPLAGHSLGPLATWLMECSGDLLMVMRRFLVSVGGVFYDFFKADLERRAWIRLETLHGDMAVFLNTDSAFCIPKAQLGGAVRAGPGGLERRKKSRKRKADRTIWSSSSSSSRLERAIPICSSSSTSGRPMLNISPWYTNQRDRVAIFDGGLFSPGLSQQVATSWFMPAL